MKRWLPVGLMFVLSCGVGGCGKSDHEALQDDLFVILNDYCDILESVTDEPSARAAELKMEKIGARLRDITTRYESLRNPSSREAERLNKKGDEAGKLLQKRMEPQLIKLEKYPYLWAPIGKCLAELEQYPGFRGIK